ncbi:Aspercryptin biosynthesis cluster-specific transcription regulator atnN [Vanrija pseudolonga]|uniref:Aspercryptin biosynthesis cluster-specific transcription regulator atnN n=1 Tax=Vanrija pseudolonga TaxID=143232 RepID=A0AAF1BP37_9TREE|nr:Aspercryptin biosynthesis cluster-specific transcription regulator atnN [Vanrija pseudolonga]
MAPSPPSPYQTGQHHHHSSSGQQQHSRRSPSASSTGDANANATAGPSSTTNDGSSVKRTRSRNGCLVCRARRIKCDLERPECKRCVNYGAECVYPIKKAFDAAAVDAALGSRHNRPSNAAATAAAYHDPTPGAGPALSPPPITPHSSLPPLPPMPPAPPLPPLPPGRVGPALDSVPPIEMVHALFRKTKMGSFFNNPVDPPEFLRLAFPLPEDLRCFHHCLTYSLSILVVDEEHNPWVEHIAPMFLFPTGDAPLSVNALKYSMLTLGATHLSYLEATSRAPNAERTLQLSRQYRHTALGLLRQARRVPEELAHDAFLASCVMILDNDILAACVSWREPLRYAKEAINHRGGAGNLLFGPDWRNAISRSGSSATPPAPVRRYLIEHAVMHDILCCLSVGSPPTVLDSDSSWWEALGNTGSTDREWESVESLFGFDRLLVRITCNTLQLFSNCREFEAHHGPLLNPPTSLSLDSPSTVARADMSRRVADAQLELAQWRAEASARYMTPRTMIGSMTLWHMLQIMMLRDVQKRPRDDTEVQSSAAAILELCIEVGDKVEFLNWALLYASSVLLDADKRNTARSILKTFAYQCCHELEVIRLVMEEMWRRADDGYDDEACGTREIALEFGRAVLIG